VLYLTEFDQLGKVNAVYAEYFPKGGLAKLACGVSALYGGAKFEIQAIAVAYCSIVLIERTFWPFRVVRTSGSLPSVRRQRS
jgi:hypothetical protein